MSFFTRFFVTTQPKISEESKPEEVKKIVSKDEVTDYAIKNNGLRFMCKDCGETYCSLSTSKQYCSKCNFWICPICNCKTDKCSECKTENN